MDYQNDEIRRLLHGCLQIFYSGAKQNPYQTSADKRRQNSWYSHGILFSQQIHHVTGKIPSKIRQPWYKQLQVRSVPSNGTSSNNSL